MLDPYRHEHTGIEDISWEQLGHLLVRFAETIADDYSPELVVGIADGGLFPAVYLASVFQRDLLPIKLSRRQNEQVVHDEPVWYVLPSDVVKGKNVLLVDDICVSGRTIEMAVAELGKHGAREIRTAALAIHDESVKPDYVMLRTNSLIVWPWDRDVLVQGTWMTNPEYSEEMEKIRGQAPGHSRAAENDTP